MLVANTWFNYLVYDVIKAETYIPGNQLFDEEVTLEKGRSTL